MMATCAHKNKRVSLLAIIPIGFLLSLPLSRPDSASILYNDIESSNKNKKVSTAKHTHAPNRIEI